MTTAYERYVQERNEEEAAFQQNRNDYLYQPGGDCHESAPKIGSCSRAEAHYTHEARGSSGNVLGRWRVRKVVEPVDPNIQLPE